MVKKDPHKADDKTAEEEKEELKVRAKRQEGIKKWQEQRRKDGH